MNGVKYMKTINNKILKEMIINGYNSLSNDIDHINNLNVFPIPDQDTGTNMFLTYKNAIKSLDNDFKTSYDLINSFSKGLLIGARGNSGVIFSQIFRGMAKYLALPENIKKTELSFDDVKGMLEYGKDLSYKAVLKPIEGTILTVIRETFESISKYNPKDMVDFFTLIYKNAEESVNNTPKHLPILKQAKVVDSGGYGLLSTFKGFLYAIKGEKINFKESSETQKSTGTPSKSIDSKSDIDYGYCTEGIIYLKNKNIEKADIEKYLESKKAESVVVIKDDDVLKFHAHVFKPGELLNYFQKFGEFYKIKIDNMNYQTESHDFVDVPGDNSNQMTEKKDIAILAVVSGSQAEKHFKELNVDYFINGGQSSNPPIKDFVDAYENINAKEIIVFPNNSNIFLTASRATDLIKDKKIYVIKNNNQLESYLSLLYIDKNNQKSKEIIESINSSISNIRTGFVTKAAKNITLGGVKVTENEYLCMSGKKIIASEKTFNASFNELLKSLKLSKSSFLTVMLGEDVTSEMKKNVIKNIKEFVAEFEILETKQPVYHILIGAEH